MSENGFRICEFCGCNTNAKMRACCNEGRDADCQKPKAGEFTKQIKSRLLDLHIYYQDGRSSTELEKLKLTQDLIKACETIDQQAERIEKLEDIFRKIDDWAKAYPLEVFPKPTKDNWKQAAEVLKANGLSLDRLSADNMRHVLSGIKGYCEQALEKK